MSIFKKMAIGLNVAITLFCYILIPFTYESMNKKYPNESDIWVVPVVFVGMSLFFWLLGMLWFPFVGKTISKRINIEKLDYILLSFGIFGVFVFHIILLVFNIQWLIRN